MVWRRRHPRSRRSAWWVRELPPVLQPFAPWEPGESMEKGGKRSGERSAVPHGPAGTHRAARLSCLQSCQSWVLHRASRGAAGTELCSGAAPKPLTSCVAGLCWGRAGGEALLALPAPLQPSLCPSPAEGRQGAARLPTQGRGAGDVDAREEAGKGTAVFAGVQQYLLDSRPGLTETLVAMGFGYFFPPFFSLFL